MALPTLWTWVWASSWRWWWTWRSGVLQSMGSQRVRHKWVTEPNRLILFWTKILLPNLHYLPQFYVWVTLDYVKILPFLMLKMLLLLDCQWCFTETHSSLAYILLLSSFDNFFSFSPKSLSHTPIQKFFHESNCLGWDIRKDNCCIPLAGYHFIKCRIVTEASAGRGNHRSYLHCLIYSTSPRINRA